MPDEQVMDFDDGDGGDDGRILSASQILHTIILWHM